MDWIELTGVEEQLQGQLPPPEVVPPGPAGTLFAAPRFTRLAVSHPGWTFGHYPVGALGDVDRDGHADLLGLWHREVQVNEGVVPMAWGWFVGFGDGSGGFLRVTAAGEFHEDLMLAGGDLDGDGDLDGVLTAGWSTRQLLMNEEREGWATVPVRAEAGARLLVLGTGDVDGDRDVDVLFWEVGGSAGVLMNRGGTPEEMRYWRPTAAPAGAMLLRIVNGLGPLRVTGGLWGDPAETAGQGYTLGYLDMQGEVVEEHLGPAPYDRIEGLGDVDGDGDVDLLLHRDIVFDPSRTSVGLEWLLNQGQGTWVEEAWQPEARLVRCPPTLCDVNDDGLMDVVWSDATLYEPGVVVALGRAGDVPQVEGRYLLRDGTGGRVLAGDMNGDGRTDLVVFEDAAYEGEGVHVLLQRPGTTAVTTADAGGSPSRYRLGRAYPNPFNPETVIPLSVPTGAKPVTLQVFDVLGHPVRRLVGGSLSPGFHAVPWDGRDESGRRVASGVYVYRAQAEQWSASGKMVKVE
ncbi:MAG: FG-GAP-like repeat-containing protein [Candidatus Latescibacterota bacterium]